MGGTPPIRFEPLGDTALLARFESEEEALAFARKAASIRLESVGVTDVVPAYRTVSLHLDSPSRDRAAIESMLRGIPDNAVNKPRRHAIPCCYEMGDDLAWVADKLNLRPEEVVLAHASVTYTVYALGFIPGFAYLGWLPDQLAGLARRESPRTAVPAGSVALAGRQTGVYPAKVPGGWHLIGKTPCRVARPEDGWFPLRPGDLVKFLPINPARFSDLAGTDLPAVE